VSDSLQKRNQYVIEGSRIGSWDFNVQTGQANFNKRYTEILGMSLSEFGDASYSNWARHTHPDDLNKAKRILAEHYAGKRDFYEVEIRMKHKAGHWVWIQTRGKVVEWDDDGKPLRMCGSHSDISTQKQLEFKLKDALNERDILIKEVHHRVKNNLQILLSLTHLKSKDGKVASNEIENSINSMARAYETIYQTKQIHGITIGEHIESVIHSIIKGLDIDFEIQTEACQKDIDFIIPIGLIITELATNSIKHAVTGSEKLKIQIEINYRKAKLYINYADNGKGFSKSALDFDKESSSFGLSIVKALVDQLDGSIEFSNHNGAVAKMEF